MRIELINTGTELLLGTVVNRHLGWIAARLSALGLRMDRQITLPDGSAIREEMGLALDRADVVIVTGGLGPTADDLTREFAADLLGRALHRDPAILKGIEDRFKSRGYAGIDDRIAKQADVPEGAVVLQNEYGTAPGLHFPGENGKADLFLLPGPPREMNPMFDRCVVPMLTALRGGELPGHRVLYFGGIGESSVERDAGVEIASQWPDLEIGYCAHPCLVELRLIGEPSQVESAALVARTRLPDAFVSDDGRTPEAMVIDQLRSLNRTVAVAESCTGGALASSLTDVSGASAVFLGGAVTYSNEEKIRQLGVDLNLLESQGAVSAEVAMAMAEGIRARSGADYALASTGIAGPDGGTETKPVGTVFIGLAIRGLEPVAEKRFFPVDRSTFKVMTVRTALQMLLQTMRKNVSVPLPSPGLPTIP